MPILTLETISKQFDERRLLDAATLAIDSGERVGVVGVNGSGKTTLLRIAAGAEQPDSGRISLGRDMRVAYLPQNPELDPQRTVLEQVFAGETPEMALLRRYESTAAALERSPFDAALQTTLADLAAEIDAAGAWTLENDARAILTNLGITMLDAQVGTLSGGQRRRVAMAAALISPADLLILDEPTNHIDVETITWLEAFLARTSAAILLVTHDRYFLDRVVTRIVEVDGGNLYSYPGNYSRFLEQKAERAATEANAESRRQTILKKELAWLARGARARTTKQQARIDRIDAMQAATPEQARGELAIDSVSRRIGKKVLALHGVSKGYGDRKLLRGLQAEIGPRDRVGIIGPNGSGKSTLLNIIAGRAQPDSGHVDVGETVHIAYYDQESAGLDVNQRVIDYVKEGGELARTGAGDLIGAGQLLERFLFPSSMHYVLIGKLSGGERRRLYLLRTLMQAPNVLILDEPTNDLDIQTLSVLEDYLDDFKGVVIAVSHDRYFLDRVAERLWSFEDGRVAEYPGGYSANAERIAESRAARAEAEQPKKAAQAKQQAGKKLSFTEQRELTDLEKQIAKLEKQQAKLETSMAAAASDYQRLTELSLELEQTSAALETAFERWAVLEEKRSG